MNRISACLILSLAVLLSVQAAFADPGNGSHVSGTVIPADDLNLNLPDNSAGIDILQLLNQSLPNGVPSSFAIIPVKSGAAFSPDATRPAPEALYLLTGSAQVSADESSVHASAGDVVVVPKGSVMIVENVGNETLTFISVLSLPAIGEGNLTQKLYRKSSGDISPVLFGNETDKTGFSVYRVLDTNGDVLPLSYDLAIVSLPVGHIIGSHYLKSGETGYILEGSGTLTVGCAPQNLNPGDAFYIPPTAVQELTATSDLKYLLVTEPYYKPDEDYSVSSTC
ncbi:MAG: cupin domain-containing protein [Methanospirillum sp.]|uniref:cupin domain-containing protein n=1 Tax=Methanospirillum sp. TaxID=45200 RepID=UPI00236A457B|nr:cupin domain-containing protein [Methanospirillum sp.]MDD1728351.1 cupin domain-containing protein [Methanospirillum sp.]